MAVRHLLAALIGLFFIFAPFWIDFNHEGAVATSIVGGTIQAAASFLGFVLKKSGWGSWLNWISLMSGVWFIIFPFAFLTGFGDYVVYIVLGITTVMLNYYTMNDEL